MLIHNHPDHRRSPDDQGGEGANEAIHQAMIALTPQLRPLLLVDAAKPPATVSHLTQMRIVPPLELACTRRDDLRGASRVIMENSRPARTEQPRAGLFLFPPRPRHWQGEPIVGLRSRKIVKRDETKFFDARNSAETEVPYRWSPSGTPRGARSQPHRL